MHACNLEEQKNVQMRNIYSGAESAIEKGINIPCALRVILHINQPPTGRLRDRLINFFFFLLLLIMSHLNDKGIMQVPIFAWFLFSSHAS